LDAYHNDKLHFFGHSGSGFTNKALKEMVDRLKPLFSAKFPFENPPEVPEKIQWVKPRLVCEVSFAEWTDDEQMRQTTFLGWRDDKNAKLVIRNSWPVTPYHKDHPVPMNRARYPSQRAK
jgi:ATP-dependent DNA ligase